MRTRVKMLLPILIAMLLVILPLVGGCAKEVTPISPAPVQQKVKIGVSKDLSGPASDCHRQVLQADRDYVDWRNKQGDIGLEIEMLWADSGYTLAREMDNYKRFREQGMVTFMGSLSASAVQFMPMLAKDKIPYIFFCSNQGVRKEPGWSWGATAAYEDETAGLIDWYMKNKWDGKAPVKVMFAGYDNEYGHAPMDAVPYIQWKWGIECVKAFQAVPFYCMDFTPIFLAAEKAGANVIVFQQSTTENIALCKDWVRLGYRDKITCLQPHMGGIFAGVLVGAKDAANGQIGSIFAAMPGFKASGFDVSAMQPCIDAQMNARGYLSNEPSYYAAWGAMHCVFEAIKLAKQDGRTPITGADVQWGLQRLDITNSGVLGHILGSETKRILCQESIIAEVQNQKFVPLTTGWYTLPDLQMERQKNPALVK